MKVSKQMAEDLAKKLVESRNAEINEVEKKLRELSDKIYEKTVPVALIPVFEKHRDFMRSTNSFQVYGNGLNGEQFKLSKSMPGKGDYTNIQPTEKECEKLKTLFYQIKDLKKAKEDLQRRTERALISLSTTKKVADQFPELKDFLARAESNKFLPIPNLEQLKKDLKNK